MSDLWIECICGAMIHEVDSDVWVDREGNRYCYPDADNEVDRAATHLRLEEA